MNEKLSILRNQIVQQGFKMGAFKDTPVTPQPWDTDQYSPFYTPDKRLVSRLDSRPLVVAALTILFDEIYKKEDIDHIVGSSYGGIIAATALAVAKRRDVSFVETTPFNRKVIRGVDPAQFEGRNILVVNDSIITGRDLADTIHFIQAAGGKVNHCLSVFSYEFPLAQKRLNGEIPYDEKNKVLPGCSHQAIITYEELIRRGHTLGLIPSDVFEHFEQHYPWDENNVTNPEWIT